MGRRRKEDIEAEDAAQAAAVEAEEAGTPAEDTPTETATPKRRGRPPGGKKAKTEDVEDAAPEAEVEAPKTRKKRGRKTVDPAIAEQQAKIEEEKAKLKELKDRAKQQAKEEKSINKWTAAISEMSEFALKAINEAVESRRIELGLSWGEAADLAPGACVDQIDPPPSPYPPAPPVVKAGLRSVPPPPPRPTDDLPEVRPEIAE